MTDGAASVSISVLQPPRTRCSSSRSRTTRRWDAVAVALLTDPERRGAAAVLWFDRGRHHIGSHPNGAQLWQMVHNIDAVHGLYYLLMHGWYVVFPATGSPHGCPVRSPPAWRPPVWWFSGKRFPAEPSR